MSKASCCCGLKPSAAAEPATMGKAETEAAKRTIQRRLCDARPLRQISLNISISQKANQDEFRQVTCSLARHRTAHLRASAILKCIPLGSNQDRAPLGLVVRDARRRRAPHHEDLRSHPEEPCQRVARIARPMTGSSWCL